MTTTIRLLEEPTADEIRAAVKLEPSLTQMIQIDMDAVQRRVLLQGGFLAPDTVERLLAEGQEEALLKVMNALPPDLRTVASTMRPEIAQMVNTKLRRAALAQEGQSPE